MRPMYFFSGVTKPHVNGLSNLGAAFCAVALGRRGTPYGKVWCGIEIFKARRLPSHAVVLFRGPNLIKTDSATFMRLNTWLREMNQTITNPWLVTVLLGNKADLADTDSITRQHREVSDSEARTFAENHKLLYYETSALTGTRCRAFARDRWESRLVDVAT